MIKHNNQKLDQIVQHDIITFLENNNECESAVENIF